MDVAGPLQVFLPRLLSFVPALPTCVPRCPATLSPHPALTLKAGPDAAASEPLSEGSLPGDLLLLILSYAPVVVLHRSVGACLSWNATLLSNRATPEPDHPSTPLEHSSGSPDAVPAAPCEPHQDPFSLSWDGDVVALRARLQGDPSPVHTLGMVMSYQGNDGFGLHRQAPFPAHALALRACNGPSGYPVFHPPGLSRVPPVEGLAPALRGGQEEAGRCAVSGVPRGRSSDGVKCWHAPELPGSPPMASSPTGLPRRGKYTPLDLARSLRYPEIEAALLNPPQALPRAPTGCPVERYYGTLSPLLGWNPPSWCTGLDAIPSAPASGASLFKCVGNPEDEDAISLDFIPSSPSLNSSVSHFSSSSSSSSSSPSSSSWSRSSSSSPSSPSSCSSSGGPLKKPLSVPEAATALLAGAPFSLDGSCPAPRPPIPTSCSSPDEAAAAQSLDALVLMHDLQSSIDETHKLLSELCPSDKCGSSTPLSAQTAPGPDLGNSGSQLIACQPLAQSQERDPWPGGWGPFTSFSAITPPPPTSRPLPSAIPLNGRPHSAPIPSAVARQHGQHACSHSVAPHPGWAAWDGPKSQLPARPSGDGKACKRRKSLLMNQHTSLERAMQAQLTKPAFGGLISLSRLAAAPSGNKDKCPIANSCNVTDTTHQWLDEQGAVHVQFASHFPTSFRDRHDLSQTDPQACPPLSAGCVSCFPANTYTSSAEEDQEPVALSTASAAEAQPSTHFERLAPVPIPVDYDVVPPFNIPCLTSKMLASSPTTSSSLHSLVRSGSTVSWGSSPRHRKSMFEGDSTPSCSPPPVMTELGVASGIQPTQTCDETTSHFLHGPASEGTGSDTSQGSLFW
eukprot:gene5515-987_t